jgi:hypothetical protein
MALDLGLSLEQLFPKREATAEDVILFLHTLWMRPDAIPCSPQIRFAVHMAVVLGSIGGWRPASLVQVLYRHVEFGWARDPSDKTQWFVTCKFEIYHVKLQFKIRRDQSHK